MRFFWLALSLTAILGSCKLMKKKEDSETKKSNNMTGRFKTLDWVHSTNIYEVNIRQYTIEG
ncbi:MAG: 1,4-alpha-glucan branching protein, partial [Chitinophagaceae bacterium]